MSSKEIKIIDIDEELLLRIGNPGAEHLLAWDTLKNVGNTLEALILALAKHSNEADETVSLEDFKLDFSGFYDGSAVPAFRLNAHPTPSLFNAQKVRQAVIKDFSIVMRNVDEGNYKAITDYYFQANAKNDIIKKVYDFTNSAGSTPVSIVKRETNNHFSKVYTVRKLKRSVFKQLTVNEDNSLEIEIEETTAVAKMVTKTSKSGKTSLKPSEIYNDKEAILSLKIEYIEFLEKKYIFWFPILFQMYQEGGGTIIENEQLDIYASGKNLTEAKIELYSQFDHSFKRLNELRDDQLSNRLLLTKQYFNSIIKSVNVV